MSIQPARPAAKPEIDDETRRVLEDRLRTIDADEKDSVDRETGREEIRQLRESLKHAVPL